MLGGPSEKKYFFSGSPPLNHSSGIQKLKVKSMVKRMNKVFFMAHMSMNCNRNSCFNSCLVKLNPGQIEQLAPQAMACW